MGLHRGDDHSFIITNGMVKTAGGSLDSVKGQVGFFNIGRTSKTGLEAVSTFAIASDRDEFIIKMGYKDSYGKGEVSDFRSFPFTVNDVTALKIRVPKRLTPKTDKLILGFDGIDPNKSFKIREGESRKITIKLTGAAIGMLGYKDGSVTVDAYIDADPCYNTSCEECDPCLASNCIKPTIETIEYLKNYNIGGGVTLSDFVDFTLVKSCPLEVPPITTDVTNYEVTIPDCGEAADLAAVQSQVDGSVVVIGRDGVNTTYGIQTGIVPVPIMITGFPTLAPKCGVCAGPIEEQGGFAYIFTADSSVIDPIAAFGVPTGISSEMIQHEGHFAQFLVITSSELSTGIIDTLIGLTLISIVPAGETATFCSPTGVPAVYMWLPTGTCKISNMLFHATLPLDECGNVDTVWDEVSARYPDALVGVVGIGDDPTIVSPLIGIRPGPVDGVVACQAVFQLLIPTDIVCEDCDPIFANAFSTETPVDFAGTKWNPVGTDYGLDCNCGIMMEGKAIEINPGECLRDEWGYLEDSVKIEVTGGYITDLTLASGNNDEPMAVTYLSRAEPSEGKGGSLYGIEKASQYHFTGDFSTDSYQKRVIQGTTSNINPNASYVDMALTVKNTRFSQSFSGVSTEVVTYHFFVEVGKEATLQDLLITLASRGGATIDFV